MSRVQDIQVSDSSLRAQYISDFINGDYQDMAILLANNPQLDSKVFVADTINDVAQILATLQDGYEINVPQYLAVLTTEFDTKIGQFKDFDEWDSNKEYSLYNFVDYNNDIYMYINEFSSIGNVPGNMTYWLLVGLRGIKGASGIGLKLKYNWSSGVQYSPLDLVSYGDSSWVAMYDNINQLPEEGSQYWFRFAKHNPVGINSSTTQPENVYLGQIWFNMKE